MRSEFSEFSYGYALTEALVDGKQHLVWPTFPTQRQERRVGYDVRLERSGYPIFLQFKLCHGMKLRTVREHAHFRLPLVLPFLRMPLMPHNRSPQHARLLALEDRGEAVFYAAPRFFHDDDFAAYYGHRAILSRSAFIRPSAIGPLSDHQDHHVAFDCDAGYGWLLSEPRRLEPILNGDEFQEEMHVQLHDERPLSDRIHAALVHVTDTVIDEISKHGRPFAARGILRRLCLAIRRVYPDFPEADTILDASDPGALTDQSERSLVAFRRELQTILDDTDAPDPNNVALLSALAQLYFDATVVLIARPIEDR